MWCSICGKYHDTTSAACPCLSYIYLENPKPPRIITCPHCGKDIIIEVKQ
jgi:PHP family Zn ribbon phosphoesterase